MNVQRCLAMGATLSLGMGLGGIFSWQPSFAQPKVEQMTVGRYQVAAFRDSTNFGAVVVIDTATGQCWKKSVQQSGTSWETVGSPLVRGGK
jgi:hypothetical protein